MHIWETILKLKKSYETNIIYTFFSFCYVHVISKRKPLLTVNQDLYF